MEGTTESIMAVRPATRSRRLPTALEVAGTTPGPPRQLCPAVDRKRAAGDVVGLRIDQEKYAASDFFGPGHPPARQCGACLAHDLLREILALARRVGPARVENVDADAMGSQLQRRRSCHLING